MTVSTRIIDRLNTVNRQHPWSHNDAYLPLVLRQARCVQRAGGTRALDVGCGSGNLIAKLTTVFTDVTGVEPDPRIGEMAEARFQEQPNVRIARIPFERATGEYDLISMVAVLHHLPLTPTLLTARRMLRPGGRLVVVGVAREDRGGAALSTASMVLNPLVGVLSHRGRPSDRPTGMTAPTTAATQTFPEIRAAAQRVMPGITMHRGLFWRYLATWSAPQ